MTGRARHSTACRNCGAPLQGRFCASCGQEDQPLDPSIGEVVGEMAREISDLDGRIPRCTKGGNVMVNVESRTSPVTRWLVVTCLAGLLVQPGSIAAQSRFSGIVVFGTSLSDPGNAFVLVGEQSTPPDYMLDPLLIPSAPYARGGHHFSNGATWIEQFARPVGLAHSVRPALATPDPAVTNFAVGAARAYDDGVNFNLSRQVDLFLQRNGGVASSQALYVIEMGSNDIRDAFALSLTGGNGAPILSQALASIAANIQRLYAAGAREFLVWSSPNVALSPAARTLGEAAGAVGTQVTQAFNAGLAQVLGQLTAGLPGSSFTLLDAYQVMNAIVAAPASFDLTTVTTACLTPNVPPFACHNADEFLFWDGIHPTRAGHAILAGEAANVLQ
jgi:phospholipase/lecithinase/hemolysin